MSTRAPLLATTSEAPSGPSWPVIRDQRLSRRRALQGLAAAGAALALSGCRTTAGAPAAASHSTATRGRRALGFTPVPHGLDTALHVPTGYTADVLCRWGDPVLPDAPAFDPSAQTAAAQRAQFGYNCDFIGFLPLPRGSQNSDHGLLCVNHEYADGLHMFPGYTDERDARDRTTDAQLAVEMAAHGHTVIEVKRDAHGAFATTTGAYNRRISLDRTAMQLTGPAAGHPRLQTAADPSGTQVIGTLANCSGGVTPWGTVVIAEENIEDYFAGQTTGAEAVNHARYTLGGNPVRPYARIDARFDLGQHPHEANRFGWAVEIDPYAPQSTPKKRTALGRFGREATTFALLPDGRVAVYSGDDRAFEHLYRFVTARAYKPGTSAAAMAHNRDLLDDGTLYAARFDADGTLTWLPLVFGTGPLDAAHGFQSQADVLIEARRAADLVGATKLDRPEDVEAHPAGRVFVMLTKNPGRAAADVASPRAPNRAGHVLELTPPVDPRGAVDHGADVFAWDVFLLAGKLPADGTHGNAEAGDAAQGWLANPDNAAVDPDGRLWIATDGAEGYAGVADGLWATQIDGPTRAVTRRFLACPAGAELCGPCFTPDGETLFVSIQHPGASKGATYDAPSTRWPDFDPRMPPRPSVVAIRRIAGGRIGD